MDQQKHEFEPTDSQGSEMVCIHCGKIITIDLPKAWDTALEEPCACACR